MRKLVVLFLLVFSTTAQVSLQTYASDRVQKYYRISESKSDDLDHSPYLLVVSSLDLREYPHSVVTFTVSTDPGFAGDSVSRAPAAVMPSEGVDAKPVADLPILFKGRRHYSMLETDSYGSDGVSHVVFNRAAGTIYLDFATKKPKTFYFKEITAPDRFADRH